MARADRKKPVTAGCPASAGYAGNYRGGSEPPPDPVINMPLNHTVFLFDVDNTLLDNDHVTADLKRHLEQQVGHERSQRYWQLFETIRTELGYADYLGALQRYRIEHPHDPNLLAVSYFLIRY